MTTIYGTTHPVISSQTVDSSTSLTYPNDHSFALHEPTASSITSQITTPSPTAATSGTQLCESCENLCDRWYAIPDWGNLELKIIDHPFDEGSRAGCALCSVLQRYAAPPWKNLNCPKTAIAITAQGLNWSISGEYRDSVDDGWYPDVRLTTCLIPSNDLCVHEINSRSTDNPETWEKARRWIDSCCSLDTEYPDGIMAAETSTDHYLPKDKDSDSDSASVASDTPFDQRNHSLCHMEVVQSTFPARLIDVGDEDEQVRLCRIERDVEIDKVAYAALSHSWGPSGIKGITTKSNLDSRLRNLPIKTLSKTFQDAITATRRLGLRYLWIDCFCIVQDDTHDWQVESTRMGSIYANCTVNFVAAAAHGGVDGCFFDRTAWFSQRFKLFVRERADRDEKTSFICQPLGPEQPFRPENCVTSGRSWCFQETLLAPRSIYFFKDELAWECRTTSASETFPLYRPRIRIFQGTRAPKVLRSDTPLSLKSNWSHFSNWMILVTQYSEGKLTFSKDKLIAISGVARAFLEHYKSQRFGPVDCGYFAGLWRRNLEFQLLWYATQPRQRELALRAPSWSWASVDRPIWYYDSLYHLGPRHPYHINIIDLDVNCCSSDLFGEVDGGYLKLSCKQLHPVVVEDFISSNSKWTLRWLSGTCHTDPRCTFVHLDSLPIILGLAIALPVLTTVRGSEYGLLLRILRPANDANVFYRCGYYEYNPFQEIEDWQRVLRVPDEEERIIVIV